MTGRIIGLAIDVHRVLGPGLLESVYAACLCRDLKRAGIGFQRQVAIPVTYRGEVLPLAFRADVVVENTVILEIRAAAAITAEHEAQVLTYLRLSHLPIGLLMNFHALRLVDGLRRFVA
ncbi:GxxExxY protein [Rhodopila globiformis]|uniref:GxxExxY protein n=1 Tax=Rhodopila globiformis TaxID=1071 RepID=A0A2S6NGG7_RHOGL|nr:hypothetical protein CCS01_13575 [Rhodopila globiformis]